VASILRTAILYRRPIIPVQPRERLALLTTKDSRSLLTEWADLYQSNMRRVLDVSRRSRRGQQTAQLRPIALTSIPQNRRGRPCQARAHRDQGRPDGATDYRQGTISATSTWSRKLCNPSTTRSARGCYPCLRYVPLPMSSDRTMFCMARPAGFEPTTPWFVGPDLTHLTYCLYFRQVRCFNFVHTRPRAFKRSRKSRAGISRCENALETHLHHARITLAPPDSNSHLRNSRHRPSAQAGEYPLR
jgi:hypothetical protein